MNIICFGDAEKLFVETDILTEGAQINGMIFAFIKGRVDGFWNFKEDRSRRRWWRLFSSVATSYSVADISFRSVVRKSCLSLVDFVVDCAVYAEANFVVLIDINEI